MNPQLLSKDYKQLLQQQGSNMWIQSRKLIHHKE